MCFPGGGSGSKDRSKKRTEDTRKTPNAEVLTFSPERRWVACRKGTGWDRSSSSSSTNVGEGFLRLLGTYMKGIEGGKKESGMSVQIGGCGLICPSGLGLWTWLRRVTVARRRGRGRCSAPWREAWTRWSTCSLQTGSEACAKAHARLRWNSATHLFGSAPSLPTCPTQLPSSCASPLGPVQRNSDGSERPRPGPEPNPLHPAREKYRFHTERVNESVDLRLRSKYLQALIKTWWLTFPRFRYTLKCRTKGDFGKVTMAFELEVCLLQRPEVVGVRRQRLKGDAWVYKHLVENILSTLSV